MSMYKQELDLIGSSLSLSQVRNDDAVVGNIYPIYGMITGIVEEGEDYIIIEINQKIRARITNSEVQKLEQIKYKIFEAGIFVSSLVSKEPLEVECKVVIFGKQKKTIQ